MKSILDAVGDLFNRTNEAWPLYEKLDKYLRDRSVKFTGTGLYSTGSFSTYNLDKKAIDLCIPLKCENLENEIVFLERVWDEVKILQDRDNNNLTTLREGIEKRTVKNEKTEQL